MLIMRTDDRMRTASERIWSASPCSNPACTYQQTAGDVAMSVDGTIFITGYQRGWDPEVVKSNRCFVLKVNLDLTLITARTWGSTRDEQCQ